MIFIVGDTLIPSNLICLNMGEGVGEKWVIMWELVNLAFLRFCGKQDVVFESVYRQRVASFCVLFKGASPYM